MPNGLLKAKAALVFNTSNIAAAREVAVFGDPLHNVMEKLFFRPERDNGFSPEDVRYHCCQIRTAEKKMACLGGENSKEYFCSK